MMCVDPDGKRKRRGRKRKTALPGEEGGSESDSSTDGEEDVGLPNGSDPMPIRHDKQHTHDDLHDHGFGASLGDVDPAMSQGSRPFFITKPKRQKLKEDYSDDSDMDDGLPHLAGPANHFGVPMHTQFDEDDHISALSSNKGSTSTPMAVPGRSKSSSGGLNVTSGAMQAHHEDFAHFNIFPELLTLPSPASGSQSQAAMFFPSPRNGGGNGFGSHHLLDVGDAHFAASPIISGLAHSFGNSCGSTSFLNTPVQKGLHDFYPSGSNDNPPFEGFIL